MGMSCMTFDPKMSLTLDHLWILLLGSGWFTLITDLPTFPRGFVSHCVIYNMKATRGDTNTILYK